MPRHLIETKVQISTLRSLGKSWGDIEKITGVRRSTAQKTGSRANKKSSGRLKKLSVRDVRCLKRIVSKNRRLSLKEVTNTLNSSTKIIVSLQTVRRILKKNGWRRRCAAVVPSISRTNRIQRLKFCNEHENFSWDRLVFSD